jgi:hypothetical protein
MAGEAARAAADAPDAPAPYFLSTARGGETLVHEGNLFRIKRAKADNVRSWQCSFGTCTATCITHNLGDGSVRVTDAKVHGHAPQPEKIASYTRNRSLLKRALEDKHATHAQVVAANLTGVAQEDMMSLPSTEDMRYKVKQARIRQLKKGLAGESNYESLAALNLDKSLTDFQKKPFLLYDSGAASAPDRLPRGYQGVQNTPKTKKRKTEKTK